MYLKYGLLAEAIVSTSMNKHNAICIYDSVASKEFPFDQPLKMLIRIEGNPSEEGIHDFQLKVVDADYREIAQTYPDKFQMSKNEYKTAAIADIISESVFSIPKSGIYEILIIANNICLGSIPLSVVRMA